MGAVGTFYGMGPGSSIAMGFNDAVWAKYALGEYHGLKDASGNPYTRNVFNRPTKADGHLAAAALQTPNFAMLGDMMAGLGIENLQKMGTTFIMCNNALDGWCVELEARGKGTAADLVRYARRLLDRSVARVMSTSPHASSAAICGHNTSTPTPFRKIPRTITRK